MKVKNIVFFIILSLTVLSVLIPVKVRAVESLDITSLHHTPTQVVTVVVQDLIGAIPNEDRSLPPIDGEWVATISLNGHGMGALGHELLVPEYQSFWRVYKLDFNKSLSWEKNDQVVIVKNSDSTSSKAFPYEMVNLTRDETVRVSNLGAPSSNFNPFLYLKISENIFDLGLSAYDHAEFDPADATIYNNWRRFDVLIFGVNTDPEDSSYPYLIINLTRGNSARGNLH